MLSMSRRARTCKLGMTCSECQSEKHVSALHPGKASWTKDQSPSSEHCGEKYSAPPSEVTTRFTQVCGGDFNDKSCSKICLVKVHPISCQRQTLKVCTILAENSQNPRALSSMQYRKRLKLKSLPVLGKKRSFLRTERIFSHNIQTGAFHYLRHLSKCWS